MSFERHTNVFPGNEQYESQLPIRADVPMYTQRGIVTRDGIPFELYSYADEHGIEERLYLGELVDTNITFGTKINVGYLEKGTSPAKTVIVKAIPAVWVGDLDGWNVVAREFETMEELNALDPLHTLYPYAFRQMILEDGRITEHSDTMHDPVVHGVILMEYRDSHTTRFLHSLISPDRGLVDPSTSTLNLPSIRHIATELSQRIGLLASRGVIHFDIKLQHIMLVSLEELARSTDTFSNPEWFTGQPPAVILMDMGSSSKAIAYMEDMIPPSTPAYISPEVARLYSESDQGEVGLASDQYQYGLVLYEMLTGIVPDAFMNERRNKFLAGRLRPTLENALEEQDNKGIIYTRAYAVRRHGRRPFVSLSGFPLVRDSGLDTDTLDAFFDIVLADKPEGRFATIEEAGKAFEEATRKFEAP